VWPEGNLGKNPETQSNIIIKDKMEEAFGKDTVTTDSNGVPTDAAELFALDDPSRHIPCNLFQPILLFTYKDVKLGLQGATTDVKKRMWVACKNLDHGKEALKTHRTQSVSCKLMYCWAKTNHERKVITDDELRMISDRLPIIDVELQSPSVADSASASNAASGATSPSLPPTSHAGFNASPSDLPRFEVYARNNTVFRKEEQEEVVDVGISDRGYVPINVKSREAVFYTKTFNIENQVGGCFVRIEDVFKKYAKESKSMIEDAVRENTVFESNW
jgi:hypothetical protein